MSKIDEKWNFIKIFYKILIICDKKGYFILNIVEKNWSKKDVKSAPFLDTYYSKTEKDREKWKTTSKTFRKSLQFPILKTAKSEPQVGHFSHQNLGLFYAMIFSKINFTYYLIYKEKEILTNFK